MLEQIGHDNRFKQGMTHTITRNHVVESAWRACGLESENFESYAPAALSDDILRAQISKYAPRPLSYDSDALGDAFSLMDTCLHALVGDDNCVLRTRPEISAVLYTLETSKSAGPLVAALDNLTTKAEFLGGYADRPSGPVPVPSPFGTVTRREALLEWLYAQLNPSAADISVGVVSAFESRYRTSEPSYGGTLKCELRRSDKVAAGKTRLFMPSNIWDHALATCLYGPLFHEFHVNWHSPDSTMRVGASVTHGAWDTLARLHASRDHTLASDASGYDSSLPAVIVGAGGSLMSRRLRTNRTNARAYVDDRVNSTIICSDGRLVQKGCGGASGDKVTSDLNSVNRSLIDLYLIARWRQEYCPHLRLTWQWVSNRFTISTFGDDDMISFDDDESCGLNETTFTAENCTRWARELGVELEYLSDAHGTSLCGPLSYDHTFLSTHFAMHGRLYVPVSERPAKVLYGLLYSSIDFETDQRAGLEQVHMMLQNLCWDAVWWDRALRLARALVRVGFYDRAEYQLQYYHGVVESGRRVGGTVQEIDRHEFF